MKKSGLKKRGVYKFIIIAAVLFCIIRVALYDGITVRNTVIKASQVGENKTFAVISDLHSVLHGNSQEKLISELDSIHPDAVFMTGDIADDKNPFTGTATLLENIAKRYDCYYVTGNHERWVEYSDDIKAMFAEYGVCVLDDKSEPIDIGKGIRLFGIDDPLYYSDTNEFLKSLNGYTPSDEYFDILLSHRPEFFDMYISLGFDLTISGHAHGGQVRLPFLLNGLYAPNQGFFPEYAGGLYKDNGRYMLVSRGLMKNEIPRVFNPPELWVLELVRD